jgi:hypothetical protein
MPDGDTGLGMPGKGLVGGVDGEYTVIEPESSNSGSCSWSSHGREQYSWRNSVVVNPRKSKGLAHTGQKCSELVAERPIVVLILNTCFFVFVESSFLFFGPGPSKHDPS